MIAVAVVEAVEARLASGWNACPIIAENAQASVPVDGSPFLFVHYPYSREEQITFGAPGANVFREEGAFRLVLNLRRGVGLAAGRAWAAQLVALFRGQDLGGVVIREINGPVTGDENENGLYFTLAIAVGYEFDVVG